MERFLKLSRRRLVRIGVLCVALLLLEEIPRIFIAFTSNIEFSRHPLAKMYNPLVWVFNALVLLFLLFGSASWRWWRRILPSLYTFTAGMLLSTILSSLYVSLIERRSLLAYQLVMAHMWAGRLAMPCTVVYVAHHLLLWWPGASPHERKWSGIGLGTLFVLSFGIGTVFSVLGGPEWLTVGAVHNYLAWVFVGATFWHARTQQARRSTQGAPAEPARTSLLGARYALSRSRIWWVSVLSLLPIATAYGLSRHAFSIPPVLTVVLQVLEATKTDKPVYRPLPKSYALPFGPNPFRPSRADMDARGVPEARFVQQAQSCGVLGCHVDLTKNWAVSTHRHSKNPFVDKVVAEFAREKGVAATRYCAGCHDPVNLLTGQIDQGGHPLSGLDNEGITCIVCHTTAHVGIAPSTGSYVLAPTPTFFERRLGQSHYLMTTLFLGEHEADFKRDDLYKSVEFCAACHAHQAPLEINPRGLMLSNKVAEWRASPYADPKGPHGLKTCQGCHMPPILESNRNADERSHRWLGSNTGLASFYARTDPKWDDYATHYNVSDTKLSFTHAEQLAMEDNHLREKVITLDAGWGAPTLAGSETTLPLDVSLTNVGVGHNFPAGPKDLVDVWLELEVTDASGATRWSAGQLDGAGRVSSEAVHYGAELYDENGTRLRRHELWKVASVRNAHFIRSGATDRAHFLIKLPSDLQGPLTLRVRLRHRRWNPEFVDWVLGEGASAQVPISVVAERVFALPTLRH